MGVLYPEDFDNNSNHNQPPAGFIWPSGFYPIYTQHSLNLLAAEKYVEEQKMLAKRAEWNREHPWNWRTEWRMNLVGIALLLVLSFIVMLFMD